MRNEQICYRTMRHLKAPPWSTRVLSQMMNTLAQSTEHLAKYYLLSHVANQLLLLLAGWSNFDQIGQKSTEVDHFFAKQNSIEK